MTNSETSYAVGSDPRPRSVWRIVATIAVVLVALPVALGVGAWAAGQISDGDAAPTAPTRVHD